MSYIVEPFIWQKLDNESYIFQTKLSTTIITSPFVVEALLELERKMISKVDDNYFINKMGEGNACNVIRFLEENGILKINEDREWVIERIFVTSNNSRFIKMMKLLLEERYEIINLQEGKINMELKRGDLWIVFLNPFSLDEMRLLLDYAKKIDITIKIIFSYNNKIYFSNFYRKSWNNPCPECFFSSLESQLRGERTEEQVGFQTIIDILYAKDIHFVSNIPLDNLDYSMIISNIALYLRDKIKDYLLDEVKEIDVATGEVKSDTAYHWGYCDCYE